MAGFGDSLLLPLPFDLEVSPPKVILERISLPETDR
jgi:hypothetical protein